MIKYLIKVITNAGSSVDILEVCDTLEEAELHKQGYYYPEWYHDRVIVIEEINV